MHKPFVKVNIPGPASETEKREEEVDQMMKEWYEPRPLDQSLVKRRRGWKSLLFMFLLFLVVAVFGGLTIYFAIEGKSLPFSKNIGVNDNDPLLLTISAPAFANSGEIIDVVFVYQNVSKVRLTDVELQIFFPENFVFLESVPYKPYNAGQNYWKLPTLEPISSNKLTVKGQVVGSQNEQKRVEAVLLYKPTNFHTQFKKIEFADFFVNESVLGITLDGPDNLLPHQEARYTVAIKNTAKTQVQNIVVSLSLPEEFLITSSSKVIEDKSWNIPTLSAGDAQTLELTGTLNARGGDLINFKAEAAIQEQGKFLLQNYATILATVIDPDIRILIKRQDEEKPLTFGGTLLVEVSIENASTLNIADASVDIIIVDTDDLLLWNTIKVGESYSYELMDAKGEGGGGKVIRIKNISALKSSDEARISFAVDSIKVPYDIHSGKYAVRMKPVFTGHSDDISLPLASEGKEAEFAIIR